VIGLVFVASYLTAFHAPHPHGAPVAVVPGPGAAAFEKAASRASPGQWVFDTAASPTAAERSVAHGTALAALLPGSPAVIDVAGANGPSALAAVSSELSRAAVAAGLHPTLHDVDPLRSQDSSGLSLFYLAFGSVLAGYLFAIASVTLGPDLSAIAHWASSATLALLLGASVAVLAGPAFGVVADRDAPAVGGLVTLLVVGVAATTAMFLTLSRALGTVIGTVVLLTIGTVTGGVLPRPMLPGWAQNTRDLLPNGLALDAIRGVVYFHGHDVGMGVAGLALWAIVPLAAITTYQRALGNNRRADDVPVASHLSSRSPT
jgi:hypothetical protein